LPVLTNQPLTQSNLQRSKITTREHFLNSQSFFTGQASVPPLLQVRTNRAITHYLIPCSASKTTKHPHASVVYVFKERRRFCGGRFRRRAHYTDRNPRVNTFRVFHSQNSWFSPHPGESQRLSVRTTALARTYACRPGLRMGRPRAS